MALRGGKKVAGDTGTIKWFRYLRFFDIGDCYIFKQKCPPMRMIQGTACRAGVELLRGHIPLLEWHKSQHVSNLRQLDYLFNSLLRQRTHQSPHPLSCMRWIYQCRVASSHKRSVMRKVFNVVSVSSQITKARYRYTCNISHCLTLPNTLWQTSYYY